MHRHLAPALCASLLASALLLGGCSGSAGQSGNVGLTSAQLIARIDAALASVTSVRVKENVVSGGSTESLDIELTKDSGAGTVTKDGVNLQYIVIGQMSYEKATKALMMRAGMDIPPAVEDSSVGKWASSKSELGRSLEASGEIRDFQPYITLLRQNNTNVDYVAEGTTVVNGTQVAKYGGVNRATGGTTELYIPMTGPSLPLKAVEDGMVSGPIFFTWNQPTTITAPSAADSYDGP